MSISYSPHVQRSVDVPVVIPVSHVRAQPLDALGRVGLHLAIAKECKSIVEPISDVVVLEAGLLDRLEEVNCLQSALVWRE